MRSFFAAVSILWRARLALVGAALLALAISQACSPAIGDKCIVSTDCSVQGDRLCDTSQPDGYCTQLNCRGNDCADEAACVLFNSAVPGCNYDDRTGGYGSRIARSFCMAECKDNTDCRPDYVCADPRSAPWNAVILDNSQSRRGCLPQPLPFDAGDGVTSFSVESPVCQASAPLDAAAPIEASAPGISEAGSANAPPLFTDAGVDASDGG